MAITKGDHLTVAKSADAAETVAATLADLLNTMTVDTALAGSAWRLVRKLARELCELHGLDDEQVLGKPAITAVSENGHRPDGSHLNVTTEG